MRVAFLPLPPASRRVAAALAAASLALPALRSAATQPAAVPAYRQANSVAVLTVRGPIDNVTLTSLERRVQEALDDGADAIVLDLDTPGGALEATLDICHLVKTDAPPNTVAWVNPKAYSAGTIIALACREIVVAPNSSFGDAAPISAWGPIPVTERAKLESPVLAEVVDSARRNHYDEKLVQSFVSVGVELWLIRNATTGETIVVDRAEYELVMGEAPPADLTPVAPPASGAAPAKPFYEKFLDTGELPAETSMSAGEIAAQIELEQDRPSSRRKLTREDRGDWEPVRQIVSSDRLLVLKPGEAAAYGLSAAVIANDEQLKAYFGAQTVTRYDRAWSESLVQFLTNPYVRGVLLVIFVVCLLIELAAPGLGVFGTAAAIALLILIGAPWLAGMAQWWEILMIVLGLGLVAIELFVLPGFGVAGIAGAACVLVGIVGTFVSDSVTTPAGQSDLLTGLVATLTALAAAGVAGWLLFRQLETVPVLGRFVLHTEVGRHSPQEAMGPGLLESIGPAPGGEHALVAGAIGVAETDLRPAGRASFEGRLVDVKSVGAYIDRGASVRVVTVGRFAIEVEESD